MVKVPFYYGWVILVVLSITEMIALGVTAYAGGLFVLPVQNEFGLSRAAAQSSVSLILVGAAVCAPIIGRILDRYPARFVLIGGALASSFAFAICALTSSLLLTVVMLLLPAAIGFSAVGTLTTGTVLSRWFYRRRGLALGLGAVATSGGGLFVVPILSDLIATYGWRTTLLIEAGAIAAICIFLALVFVRDRPSDMGMENHPENTGRPAKETNADQGQAERPHWRAILENPTFWGVALVIGIISGISQALVTTLPPYAIQSGFSNAAAAALISAFAAAAAITKILGGLLADIINRRLIMFCSGLFMVAAALTLLLSRDYMAFMAAAILAGTSLGCALPSTSALVAAIFGANAFGSVMGWVYVLICLSSVILPPVTGGIFDRTGSYDAAFVFFAVLGVLSAFCTVLIPRRAQ